MGFGMNFIGQYNLKNLNICDELIDFFEKSENKTEGKTYNGKNVDVDQSVKKSTDIQFYDCSNKSCENYLIGLQECLNSYIKDYHFCNHYNGCSIQEAINIQRYLPNEGFFAWHCERASAGAPYSTRHLAFITYLNDVEDEGETEFFYQKVKIKPKKGLTIIFPVDWTHTHRGITSKTQTKYIITGWINYTS